MKRFASNHIFAFILVLWLALIAYASPSLEQIAAASGSGHVAGRQNAASQNADRQSLVVIDSLKNKVYLPTQVKAVASMRSGITEVICALGQKDKIIAVEEMVKAGTAYGLFITGVHLSLPKAGSLLKSRVYL